MMSNNNTIVKGIDNHKVFLTGSTIRHIIVMTLTSYMGLLAVFMVDIVDMYFISKIGEDELAGASGFAEFILLFNISVCVGLAITITSLVSRKIGADIKKKAKQHAYNILIFSAIITVFIAIFISIYAIDILKFLNASGKPLQIGLSYINIIIISLPMLAIALCLSALMRTLGDPKRAMYITFSGAAVNAILDPIFIFTLNMGVEGAALASVIARFTMMSLGLYY